MLTNILPDLVLLGGEGESPPSGEFWQVYDSAARAEEQPSLQGWSREEERYFRITLADLQKPEELVVWAVGPWENLLQVAWLCGNALTKIKTTQTVSIVSSSEYLSFSDYDTHLAKRRCLRSEESSWLSQIWSLIDDGVHFSKLSELEDRLPRVSGSDLCQSVLDGFGKLAQPTSGAMSVLDQTLLRTVAENAGRRMAHSIGGLICDEVIFTLCGDGFIRQRIESLIDAGVLRIDGPTTPPVGKLFVTRRGAELPMPELRIRNAVVRYATKG
jgi:hypothetical protein